jgi:integrase
MRGTVAGQSIFESTGTAQKDIADRVRIRTEAALLDRATLGPKATATFGEAALNYLNSGGEGRFLEPVLLHFGPDAKLQDIDNAAVAAAAEALYPGAAPATVNRQLITPVRAVLNMAAQDGLCDPKVIRSRKVGQGRTRWLRPAEFDALAAELPAHLKPLATFMVGSGVRAREALTLQADQLYLETGEAYLQDTKSGRPRMVRFPGRARDVLAAAELASTGAVFRTQRGLPYVIRDNTGGQFKVAWNKARARAGLGRDVTPHVLRHTWSTWFYAQTRDFGGLLDLGGWADADTANIYRKIAPADLGDQLLAAGWDFRSK